jgi:hypothetical protein
MSINRKILSSVALLTVVAASAIIGGLVWTAQATGATSTGTTDTTGTNNFPIGSWCMNNGTIAFGDREFGGGSGHRGEGCYGQIVVSEEFKQKVISIADNDTDVQNLLAQGYNATYVKPIISSVVDGEGVVTTKATSAILILQKDTTGSASVLVDLEQAKVTRIVILTRTVIDKS